MEPPRSFTGSESSAQRNRHAHHCARQSATAILVACVTTLHHLTQLSERKSFAMNDLLSAASLQRVTKLCLIGLFPIEAEQLRLEGLLRDFTRLRNRLVAGGRDPQSTYDLILGRRDCIVAELRRERSRHESASVDDRDGRSSTTELDPVTPFSQTQISPVRLGPDLTQSATYGYAGHRA